MSLAEEYARQERWRRWDEVLAGVPVEAGQRVLELGCGAGAVAARLVERGAVVCGVDLDEALLVAARARAPTARFELADIRGLSPATHGKVDGIFSSFAVAYLPDLDDSLSRWRECLMPGGWMTVVEVDSLLTHSPMAPGQVAELERFYAASRAGRGYDFQCARRLAEAAERSGFRLVSEKDLHDEELSFDGPATPEVLEAWQARLARMVGLKRHFGERAPEIERAVLSALSSDQHRSGARVIRLVCRC